jgi:hypothetical protein
MSYSFNGRAATKTAAKEFVAAELAKVISSQPIHVRDRDQAQAAANAFIDLVEDDDTKDVSVSVNGSVGWNLSLAPGAESSHPLTAAAVSVSAYLVAKEAAKA